MENNKNIQRVDKKWFWLIVGAIAFFSLIFGLTYEQKNEKMNEGCESYRVLKFSDWYDTLNKITINKTFLLRGLEEINKKDIVKFLFKDEHYEIICYTYYRDCISKNKFYNEHFIGSQIYELDFYYEPYSMDDLIENNPDGFFFTTLSNIKISGENIRLDGEEVVNLISNPNELDVEITLEKNHLNYTLVTKTC